MVKHKTSQHKCNDQGSASTQLHSSTATRQVQEDSIPLNRPLSIMMYSVIQRVSTRITLYTLSRNPHQSTPSLVCTCTYLLPTLKLHVHCTSQNACINPAIVLQRRLAGIHYTVLPRSGFITHSKAIYIVCELSKYGSITGCTCMTSLHNQGVHMTSLSNQPCTVICSYGCKLKGSGYGYGYGCGCFYSTGYCNTLQSRNRKSPGLREGTSPCPVSYTLSAKSVWQLDLNFLFLPPLTCMTPQSVLSFKRQSYGYCRRRRLLTTALVLQPSVPHHLQPERQGQIRVGQRYQTRAIEQLDMFLLPADASEHC